MVEPKNPSQRGPKLGAAARIAREEALEHLGDDADRFLAAITRYVNAVELADQARRSWMDAGRPIIIKFRNGMEGQDPRLAVMERWESAAAKFGEALGLTPAAERKIGRIGVYGRPVGATSAPDRVPRVLLARRGGLRAVPGEPPRFLRGDE